MSPMSFKHNTDKKYAFDGVYGSHNPGLPRLSKLTFQGRSWVGLQYRVDVWMGIHVSCSSAMHFWRLGMEHGWSDTKIYF